MRVKLLPLVLAAAVLAAAPRLASADPIIQPHLSGASSLAVGFGQSFTADDAFFDDVTIWYDDFNAFLGPATITVELYQGVGFGGALLGSATRSLEGLMGLQTFDFAPIATTLGSLYSFRVSSVSGRGAAGLFQHSFPSGGLIDPARPDYAGGHLLDIAGVPSVLFDLTFQVNTASVPEPGTLACIGLGLAIAGLRRRQGRA
jgi:hypothetical protein